MRTALAPIVLVLLAGAVARAQTPLLTLEPAVTQPADEATPADSAEVDEKKWSVSLSAYTYIVENSRDYVQPTVRVDHDRLHLEVRYNYENLDTASVWAGYNFSVGDELTLDFTAMIGGVFGRTKGVAPGCEFTLAWKKLQLYSELEYVIDAEDVSDSFLYTWSELTYGVTDWLRAGVVIQRTKAYESNFDIQRGLMLGVTYKQLDFTAAVLNPDDDPIVVLGVSLSF